MFFWGLNSVFMQIPPFVSLCKYASGHMSEPTLYMRNFLSNNLNLKMTVERRSYLCFYNKMFY